MEQRFAVVIVGGGAAGHACAAALRRSGFAGRVTVVDGEEGGAVNRTLVDTGVLPGLLSPEQIRLPPLADVEVWTGRAERLGAAREAGIRGHLAVALADGRRLEADAVVLACGSDARMPAGLQLSSGVGVHLMHTAADATALREALAEPAGRRIVLLGAGFIGTELATHFAGAGAEVVLVGRSALPLRAALGTAVASRLAELHRERIDARLGVDAVAVRERGGVVNDGSDAAASRGVEVELSDGTLLEADIAVVAQGTVPATAWAGFVGGVPVDDRLRAEPAGVYAAGAAAVLDITGERMRIDHWDDSSAQGAHAAAALLHDLGLGEDPGPYLPRAGFTLMAHGTAVAGRGAPLRGAIEQTREVEGGPGAATGLLSEFVLADGRLCGLAGIAAGPALVREAGRLFA